jgi:hypothetical protein
LAFLIANNRIMICILSRLLVMEFGEASNSSTNKYPFMMTFYHNVMICPLPKLAKSIELLPIESMTEIDNRSIFLNKK